ncbi:MAG: MOSC domain-containing protein [Candidatus Coatesbacteria bacterium]|nr:MOSC domain-containing protein [Candidatus Coatesbacteria bacterium]
MQEGKVASVNISTEKGTVKKPAPQISIDANGIRADAHAGNWHRQVSLLSMESIERFSERVGREFHPGEFAENITTRGIDLSHVGIFDRFEVAGVSLEVTQIGKACHPDGCAIFQQVGKCVMPKEGIFCRTLFPGEVRAGDMIKHYPRPLSFLVITLSDRASRGEYEDRSGPRVSAALEDWLGPSRWWFNIENNIQSDDPVELRDRIRAAESDGIDVLITTGGTGLGPRDHTPDVMAELCDKLIPGIMEHIRIKYGTEKPNALLSRAVAGVIGKMLVYSLPGSVRAVDEYMGEILKTMEHLILTVNGIDPHASL